MVTMEFETALRFFLGESADHTEGHQHNTGLRNQWFRKVIRKMMKAINDLDTTESHKVSLMNSLESFKEALARAEQPTWEMISQLLVLSGKLLGYYEKGLKGARCYTPIYWRNSRQYDTYKILNGAEASIDDEKKDAISIQRKFAQELKERRVDCFKIALILNTTEYHIKKLLRKD